MVLSTGEMPMAAKINEDRNGRRAQAGQAVRLLDIPADANKGFGVFDHAGTDNDAARLADALKRAARTTYGTAGPAFVKRLAAENSKEAAKHITAAIETFVDSHAIVGADGQVRRAAQRLGLIGAAGEMAAGWGIVPWAPGEAFAAAEAALASWVEGRGGTEGAEVREAISRVRLFIETHGDSRFEPVDKSDDFRPVTNRAGWRKGTGSERVWLVPAETWKTEICSGIDAGLAARVLADRGMLVRGDDGFLRVHRIEGRSQRAYTITAEIMGGDASLISALGKGVYAKVGAQVAPGTVEDIVSRRNVLPRISEHGWTPAGRLWFGFELSLQTMTAGGIRIASFVADLVQGEWNVFLPDDTACGSVTCRESFIWSFRKAFALLGAEAGDLAAFEFDLQTRTVHVRSS
jgi:hypothetical protein